ncbi:hypothetical protein U0070_025650 [Myodes glareolus]|uniref:Uncharacterized protein n=1 Tax=Myodes glareolus TaxID=447135 RepID=A0AAW0I496_MYOGA
MKLKMFSDSQDSLIDPMKNILISYEIRTHKRWVRNSTSKTFSPTKIRLL